MKDFFFSFINLLPFVFAFGFLLGFMEKMGCFE